MANHIIEVSEKNGFHVCNPTHTKVSPGDKVNWRTTARVLIVNFKGGTPFMEGPGPFGKDDVHTVLNKPPLVKDQRFQPDFILDGKVLKTEGDIIINGG